MNNVIKIAIISILSIGILGVILFYTFIYLTGRNFVNETPASAEYYEHVRDRVSFAAKYRGEKFDSLLTNFLENNPSYKIPDSVTSANSNIDCNCFSMRKEIYFNNDPKEVYLITYDKGDISSGVIDIVYQYIDKKWIEIKTSKLDSTNKVRIEDRLQKEVIKNLSE